jgi:MarR family transcriptional regulator, organic hydroperoxide resistance regulator
MNMSVSRMDLCIPTDDFSKSFMFSIHQMCFLVQKHLDHVLLKKKSLTFSQFIILVSFKCSPTGETSQSDIAERLNLTEATVSRHISTLVQEGFLSRAEDKSNRRKHVISITAKGKRVFATAAGHIDKELNTILSPINQKDRANIMENFAAVLELLLGKK